MKEDMVKAYFLLAEIKVLKMWRLTNQYCLDWTTESPWWLVKTDFGLVEIGRRKRVWSIDWEETNIRKILCDDNTTNFETYIHAWTEDKIIEYLRLLKKASLETTK